LNKVITGSKRGTAGRGAELESDTKQVV
jgi:hypothetical protein